VTQDYKESLLWYRKAADQGLVKAQYSLGVAYQKGLGVDVDLVQAHKWLSMAATAGDAKAQEADKLVVAKMERDGQKAAAQPKQAAPASTSKKSAPAKPGKPAKKAAPAKKAVKTE
jgi:TPR repeat protein